MDEYHRQLSAGLVAMPGASGGTKPGLPESEEPAQRNSIFRIAFNGSILAVKIFAVMVIIVALLMTAFMLLGYFETNRPTTYAIPVYNMSGGQITLVDNRNATDPTYAQLISFLESDDTSSIEYVSPTFTCADFAKRLHDNAEAHGIKASFVALEFYNNSIDYSQYDDGSGSFSPPTYQLNGHAVDLFNTTDRGPVYVDASSLSDDGDPQSDRIAYVAEGKEFGEIDLKYANSTDYSFYLMYKNNYLDYIHDQKDYNLQVKAYNQEIASYNGSPIPPDKAAGLNQTAIVLSASKEKVDAEKAGLGPFYLPIGVVKEIEIYQ